MRQRFIRAFAAASILAVLAVPFLVRAEAGPGEEGGGEDERAASWSVGRLRVLEGTAWVLSPDRSDWEPFEGNVPLTAGSRVRMAEDSSSSVTFDGGIRARLHEGTDLEIRSLREDRVGLGLHEGRVDFRIVEDAFQVPINVVLPDGQVVRFDAPGRFRIESRGPGESALLQVRQGEARLKVDGGKYRVREGEEARIGEGVSIARLRDPADDDLPAREDALTDVERTVPAPPDVVYELRDYGEWVTVPSYGVVWRPRVAAGWSPYFYGRWIWVASFGWSWISVEPWGWYPYRCGYWFLDPGFGWCWTPYRSFVSVTWRGGHRDYRPVGFYPATVRFVRESSGFRWVPLRPGERVRRPEVPPNDRSLSTWWKPVPRETVFRRAPETAGREASRWRDVAVERPDRRPPTRPAPVFRPAPPRPVDSRPAPAERMPRVRPAPAPGGQSGGDRIWKRPEDGGGGSRPRIREGVKSPEGRPAIPGPRVRERSVPAGEPPARVAPPVPREKDPASERVRPAPPGRGEGRPAWYRRDAPNAAPREERGDRGGDRGDRGNDRGDRGTIPERDGRGGR